MSHSVTVFLSSFLTSVFVGIIRTYIRTIYTHRLYARDKTSSGFAKIVRVSSVNLKTVFTCYSKQRILVHYGKGYKAARRYSNDLKLLRSLPPNGFRQTSRNCFTQSVLTTSSLTLALKSLAHSRTATLTRKLQLTLENHFTDVYYTSRVNGL